MPFRTVLKVTRHHFQNIRCVRGESLRSAPTQDGGQPSLFGRSCTKDFVDVCENQHRLSPLLHPHREDHEWGRTLSTVETGKLLR